MTFEIEKMNEMDLNGLGFLYDIKEILTKKESY